MTIQDILLTILSIAILIIIGVLYLKSKQPKLDSNITKTAMINQMNVHLREKQVAKTGAEYKAAMKKAEYWQNKFRNTK